MVPDMGIGFHKPASRFEFEHFHLESTFLNSLCKINPVVSVSFLYMMSLMANNGDVLINNPSWPN